MKNIFIWVRSNLALALFLGLQIFALAAGFVWIGSISLKEMGLFKKEVVMSDYIYADHTLIESIKQPFESYKKSLSKNTNIYALGATESEVISKLTNNKTHMILLSRKLTEDELSTFPSNRLPVTQREIKYLFEGIEYRIVAITDNEINKTERGFAAALDYQSNQTLAGNTTGNKKTATNKS